MPAGQVVNVRRQTRRYNGFIRAIALVGGSFSYDLMYWRDLDLYMLDNAQDVKNCFAVGYEITNRLLARKACFTNNSGQFQADRMVSIGVLIGG